MVGQPLPVSSVVGGLRGLSVVSFRRAPTPLMKAPPSQRPCLLTHHPGGWDFHMEFGGEADIQTRAALVKSLSLAVTHWADGETEPRQKQTRAPSSLSTPFLKPSKTRTVKQNSSTGLQRSCCRIHSAPHTILSLSLQPF